MSDAISTRLRSIERQPGVAPGRSSASAAGCFVFAVASADDKSADLRTQTALTFEKVDRLLRAAGTDGQHILSATVYLANIEDKSEFDTYWRDWVGDDPQGWPQRACIGAVLSKGTRVEISLIALRPLDTAYPSPTP